MNPLVRRRVEKARKALRKQDPAAVGLLDRLGQYSIRLPQLPQLDLVDDGRSIAIDEPSLS
jgi:hypothetical protein